MKLLFSVEDVFIVEPLGIMQMIAVAKRMGHQCYFSIYSNKEKFLALVKEVNPEVIAFSIMSISAESCKSVIKEVRQLGSNAFIVVGGPHPTYYPRFIQESEADAICVGEGDNAFADLLRTIEAGSGHENIPNICTKTKNNPLRALVEDLDSVPFPDRELVYNNSSMAGMKLKSFMATRGCPYSCTYCFNSGYKDLYKGKGKILRRRSVSNLIQEIDEVKKTFPLRMVRFGDDVFIERMDDWLGEFSEEYSRRIKLPFYCLLSPKVVTGEIAKKLKKAGCVSVAISIETGDEKMRFEVLKRRISDSEIVSAIRTLTGAGIRTYTNIMVGLPQASLADEIKSLKLAFDSRTSVAAFTIFTPFPGTQLYESCVQRQLIPKSDNPVFLRSTTDRSILNCFTEKEKDIQKNIVLLGTLANGSRILRALILKFLIYLKPNRLFFYISFLSRNYYNYRYIWPLPLSFKEFFGVTGIVLRHDKKYIQ
jgi:radical SAM superfamily enzyme YgiQ (UPF0313 family)